MVRLLLVEEIWEYVGLYDILLYSYYSISKSVYEYLNTRDKIWMDIDLTCYSTLKSARTKKPILPALLRHLSTTCLFTKGGSKIESLTIRFSRHLTDQDLGGLPMPRLRSLRIGGCASLTDAGLEQAATRVRSLRVLELYWQVNITDEGVVKFLKSQRKPQKRKHQGEKTINDTTTIINAEKNEIQTTQPNHQRQPQEEEDSIREINSLEEVNLSGCTKLTDQTIHCLLDVTCCSPAPHTTDSSPPLSSLQSLDLTRCLRINGPALCALCSCARSLRSLNLYACRQLGGSDAFENLHFLSQLEELNLCGTAIQDKQMVQCIATCGGNIRKLDFSWAMEIADETALAISTHCRCVEWLSFHGNCNISDKAFQAMVHSRCAFSLRSLDIRGCAKLHHYTANSNELLKEAFPNVTCYILHT